MNVFSAFDLGWRYTKRHGIILSLFLFCIYLLLNYLSYYCFPAEFWEKYAKAIASGSANVVNEVMKLVSYFEEASTKIWLLLILLYLIMAGVLNVALSIRIGETKRMNLKYMSLPFGTYLNVLTFGCMMLLIFTVSAYLLMIPFIYFSIRFIFVLPLMLEFPGTGSFEAMRKSWQMTQGQFFPLLGFCALSFAVLLVGCACMCVGIFPAIVICMFAFLSLYQQAKQLFLNPYL